MPDDSGLPEALRRPAELLRELPPVRAEWRRDLQAALDSGVQPSELAIVPGEHPRRLVVSVPMAIAACLVCAVLGGAVARFTLVGARPTAPSTLAQNGVTTPVRFDLVAPSATRVTIVGDFNQWNAEALPMRRSADGKRWEIEVKLPPGRYTYGFVVDGLLRRDPNAPETASDDFGIPNSVLMVARRGGAT
jgi:hypothetical protein